RLAQAKDRLVRFRAVIQGHAPRPTAARNGSEVERGPHASSVLSELESALYEAESSIPFLMIAEGKQATDGPAGETAADAGKRTAVFTPACTLSNVEAIQFGLKGALAASTCYVLYQALNWPGISTCVVTTLLVAQSSFGAGLQKSLLRLMGATLGGVMAAL